MVRASWEKAGISKSTFIFLTYPTALQLFFNTVDDEYNTIFAKLTKKKLFEALKKIIPNQILRVWGWTTIFPRAKNY